MPMDDSHYRQSLPQLMKNTYEVQVFHTESR